MTIMRSPIHHWLAQRNYGSPIRHNVHLRIKWIPEFIFGIFLVPRMITAAHVGRAGVETDGFEDTTALSPPVDGGLPGVAELVLRRRLPLLGTRSKSERQAGESAVSQAVLLQRVIGRPVLEILRNIPNHCDAGNPADSRNWSMIVW